MQLKKQNSKKGFGVRQSLFCCLPVSAKLLLRLFLCHHFRVMLQKLAREHRKVARARFKQNYAVLLLPVFVV